MVCGGNIYGKYGVPNLSNLSKISHENEILSHPPLAHNVETTSIQRHDVVSTLMRRCIKGMCSLNRF